MICLQAEIRTWDLPSTKNNDNRSTNTFGVTFSEYQTSSPFDFITAAL
jgi:hypothetical protein